MAEPFFNLIGDPVGLLFTVVASGLLLGRIPFGKFRLGASGVLIVGLVFGHFHHVLPKDIQTIGVVLFVYSMGLQSGPYIVESLKKSKGTYLLLAFVIVGSAMAAVSALKCLFGLSPGIAVGLFAGAMTSTPALAAGIEALGDSTASVGYGLAYPCGIIGVIVLVQVLPGWMRADLREEEKKYQDNLAGGHIFKKTFRVENVNAVKETFSGIMRKIHPSYRIVRVMRDGKAFTPQPDLSLKIGDYILAVGKNLKTSDLEVLFGPEVDEDIPYSEEAISRWAVISSKKFVGRRVGQMEIGAMHGIIISRVRRGDIEFSPSAEYVFEAGDEIRISGEARQIQAFEDLVKQDRKSLHETDFFTFSLGLALGVLAGYIRIPLGDQMALSFGIAGGPLLVGLIFGHFGRFGSLCGRMPKAAMLITGELGLDLFLAVAGCSAGVSFVQVLMGEGLKLILIGAVITVVPILTAIIVGRLILKTNFLVLLGAICGGMTSTPAIGVLTKSTGSDVPALGYTGIYPMAVLLTTLAAQLIVLF